MNSISTLLKVSVGALLLPLGGAFWLTYLTLTHTPSPWAQPGERLKENLEQQLIFSFSPLVEWLNRLERSGASEIAAWSTETAELLAQSPGLQELTWFVSDQGTPRALRHASRLGTDLPSSDSLDPEIFQYVKNGQRPMAFAYRSRKGPLFEFQAPLHSGNLFLGIVVARYHLPDLLTPILGEAPPNLSLVLWNRDAPLTEPSGAAARLNVATSTFIPIEVWGKKLTAEIRSTFVPPQSMLPIQWLGFVASLLIVCTCASWRRPPQKPRVPFDKASSDWFPGAPGTISSNGAGSAPSPNEGDEKMPVWAIAQQERIQAQLKKS